MTRKIHLNTLLDIDIVNAFPALLCLKLPQINEYCKYLDKNNKFMNMSVNYKEMLKNILQHGIKLIVYLKKNLIVNQCNDKYIKTKIKICNDRVYTNSQ